MASVFELYQLVANSPLGMVVYRVLQYAMPRQPNNSEQAVDFDQPVDSVLPLTPRLIGCRSSHTTIDMTGAASDTIPPESSAAPLSQDSGQPEDAHRCAAAVQTKVLSAVLSFLTLCLYLAIQVYTVTHPSCKSDCDQDGKPGRR